MARVLIACEESQAVCKAFRARGHEAYSCDLQPCSGGHPEWHIQADALEVCKIDWDMVLAFPPCTDLAVSGARWFEDKRRNGSQHRSIGFFLAFTTLDHVSYVAIENPVGIMSNEYRKPDQIIQPWMFGHPETKATCLWLKGLPLLEPTDDVEDAMEDMEDAARHRIHHLTPSPNRQKIRSKTFPGIAKAMADQWGPLLEEDS